MYDVTTGSAVSDATFFPSDIGTGYDMFLAATDSESIYPVHLGNGQVTTIQGNLCGQSFLITDVGKSLFDQTLAENILKYV